MTTPKTYSIVSLARVLVLVSLPVLASTLSAHALEGDSGAEQKKIALVKAMCGDHGLLAKCVGLSPESCSQTMKPLVDTCYERRNQPTKPGVGGSPEEVFQNCFWSEYLKKYRSRIKYSDEECTGSSEGKSPLQELPPHLEEQTQPLNPPDKKG